MIADDPRGLMTATPLTTPAVLVDRAREAGDLAALLRRDAAWTTATDQERQTAVHRLAFQRHRCNPRGRLHARVEPRRRLVYAIAVDVLTVVLLVAMLPLLMGWLALRRVWRAVR